MIDLFVLIQMESKIRQQENGMAIGGTMLESRWEEMRLDANRQQLMTPAQMERFYVRERDPYPSLKERLLTAIGDALIVFGQQLKPQRPTSMVEVTGR